MNRNTTSDGTGIPGGVGGGTGYQSHALFYVGVPDVETALEKAESLGGKRLTAPEIKPGGGLVVGHFSDPEDNLIGLPARSKVMLRWHGRWTQIVGNGDRRRNLLDDVVRTEL